MAAAAEQLTFSRQERLRFVEATLMWEGSIQRHRVCEVFGVTPNHVTKDLAHYQRLYPARIVFQARERAYFPGPRFEPAFATNDPAEFLGLVQARTESGATGQITRVGPCDVPAASLPSPAKGIDSAVLQEVLRGIRHGTGVHVVYHSLSAAQPIRTIVWPHALFNSGLRWYARAWDEGSRDFRDFVVSRMREAKAADEVAGVEASRDTGWHTMLKAEVVPHPKLNAHQQHVVALEFAMKRTREGWLWSVPLRQSLVGYFARRYQLDAKLPVSASSHFIVLRNRAALKAYFLPEVDS